MLSLPAGFAGLAAMAGAAFGGPYYDGFVISQGTPGGPNDDGVFQPGSPATRRPCQCQIDAAPFSLQASDGFVDGEVVFLVLSASLTGGLDTDATIEIPAGPQAGTWLVSSLDRDPMAIGWRGKGKRK